jgi:ankyrin repeat protein
MSNAFLEAAMAGDLPKIKQMLAENPARITEVEEGGNTALHLAAAFGQLVTVIWLLQKGGARVGERNLRQSSALLCASAGHLEVVRWLLKEGGADIGENDNCGNSGLLVAPKGGHLEVVRWLLKEGGSSIGEANNNVVSSQPPSICWSTEVPTLGIRKGMATRSGTCLRFT